MSSVVDTSFLVALFNPEDAHHEKARALFEAEGPQIVTQPTLTEFLSYVHYNFRQMYNDREAHAATRERLRRLTSVLRFHVRPLHQQRVAMKIFSTHRSLSFADAAAVADAPPGKGGLWTFDGRQAKVHRQVRG